MEEFKKALGMLSIIETLKKFSGKQKMTAPKMSAKN
jgi:hypothetical protein